MDMYHLHQEDWTNAQRVAEQFDPASVGDVLVARGRSAVASKNYPRAEGQNLSAGKPELALAMYSEARMWPDATRVAKRHLPHKLNEVQHRAHAGPVRAGRWPRGRWPVAGGLAGGLAGGRWPVAGGHYKLLRALPYVDTNLCPHIANGKRSHQAVLF